jgi:hypothetical protein
VERACDPWRPEVSCYAIDDGARLLLFDPPAVPDEIEQDAERREPVVVLTTPCHERGAQELMQRLGASVFVARPDEGSPHVAWLVNDGALDAHVIAGGDRLPLGAEAFAGRRRSDLVLWIESRRAVGSGDTLVDFGGGLHISDEWLWGVAREQVADALGPLLDLPVELVLPTHGPPADRGALPRALA